MAGIAGIATRGANVEVEAMLDRIRYRGISGISVFEANGNTVGLIWNESEIKGIRKNISEGNVAYNNGPGHFAVVKPGKKDIILYRDELGVAPLYYASDKDGNLCFASEVKALLPVTNEIKELPPGHFLDNEGLNSFFCLKGLQTVEDDPGIIATDLLAHLDRAVSECIKSDDIGSWLSGGLDSSAICALATKKIRRLKTFASGFKGAPDLRYAKEMAQFIKSEHHEMIVTINDLIEKLPDVIYHLESFDALLVRSSITNYLVAKLASDYVSEVFSGEGGDELFAGYRYLKSIPQSGLENELLRITVSLHNTAFQRVDRCASAHGLVAHLVFANPDIVRYAFTIPAKYKIYNNTEKWILRQAMKGLLPENILYRPKVKFWEGAGVEGILKEYAESQITDNVFRKERKLSNGLIINSKEELFYYRIFKHHFGPDIDLSWMGRTRGSPVDM